MTKLTHLNAAGEAHMVDVGTKPETKRIAIAAGRIVMRPETLELVQTSGLAKGDVLAAARLAGIMAAKKTAELVPLCHPLPLSRVEVELDASSDDEAILCTATAETIGRTGVEMEALTAVEIALLTIYDMCKAVDRAMTITDIHLVEKSGGRSGTWRRNDA